MSKLPAESHKKNPTPTSKLKQKETMSQMAHLTVRAKACDKIPLIGSFVVKMVLVVHFPSAYPDELPELTLTYDDPNMDQDDEENLIAELLKVVSVLLPLEGAIRSPLVANRKPSDGDDFYPSGTFT